MVKRTNKTKINWLKIFVPALIIMAWLGISGIGGPTFGKISNVTNNNQVAFLPASADSTKVQNIEQKFSQTDSIPAIVIITSHDKLTRADLNTFNQLSAKIKTVDGVSDQADAVAGPIPSQDGYAAEYVVQVSNGPDIKNTVKDIRQTLTANLPSHMNSYVSGPAGLTADLINAFGGIDGILLLVALVTVFIILLLVYRSIILPFVVLGTAVFALSGAILFVYQLALHGDIKLNGQSQGILSILVIGAATDYSLLLISRYKESLHDMQSKWSAMAKAYKRVIGPISASAATVILALLCLLFSDLNSNRSLGPIAALGIVFAFLAALSFLPSVLVLFGRKAYWPFEPQYQTSSASKVDKITFWDKVSELISKKPRLIWLTCLIVLIGLSLGLTQIKASGVTNAQTILGSSNAVKGQTVIAEHFSAGNGSPLVIIASSKNYESVIKRLNNNTDIVSSAVLTNSGFQPLDNLNGKTILIKNNQVLINSTLKVDADSSSAQQVVSMLRQELRESNMAAYIGGTSAIALDSNNTAKEDLHKIIPIVLVVILIILILLLRAFIGPLLLILSVVISYAATLGVSALVFNHIFHFPGADPAVPLFGFIFLVALGVDYNIFLMTRVREEAHKIGTHQGVIKGLSVTGSVITSAGIILAATFASLAVIPILFLAQIAFIVAFGVLLDTIVVRSLLVPSLSYDIGKFIWWPAKLWRLGTK